MMHILDYTCTLPSLSKACYMHFFFTFFLMVNEIIETKRRRRQRRKLERCEKHSIQKKKPMHFFFTSQTDYWDRYIILLSFLILSCLFCKCSFFSWFSETQMKDLSEGFHDEVTYICPNRHFEICGTITACLFCKTFIDVCAGHYGIYLTASSSRLLLL